MSVEFWIFIVIMIVTVMVIEKISNASSIDKTGPLETKRSNYDDEPIKDSHYHNHNYINQSDPVGKHPSYQDMYANPTKNAVDDANKWDY